MKSGSSAPIASLLGASGRPGRAAADGDHNADAELCRTDAGLAGSPSPPALSRDSSPCKGSVACILWFRKWRGKGQ